VLGALGEEPAGVRCGFVRTERIVIFVALVEHPKVGLVGLGVAGINERAGFIGSNGGQCFSDQSVERILVTSENAEPDEQCEHLIPVWCGSAASVPSCVLGLPHTLPGYVAGLVGESAGMVVAVGRTAGQMPAAAHSSAQPRCVFESVIFDGRVVGLNWCCVQRHRWRITEKTGHTTMKLRIDTSDTTFVCTRAPEPRTEFDTGQPKIDHASGLPLWVAQLMALDSSGGEVIAVTVAGDPKITVGQPAQVDGLVALPWSQSGRSGVAFRAEAIRATGAPLPGVVAAPKATTAAGTPSNPGKAAA
jgi:hypothetical protein